MGGGAPTPRSLRQWYKYKIMVGGGASTPRVTVTHNTVNRGTSINALF